jgi:hypothetical protein
MAVLTTLSQAEINSRKAETLNSQSIRKTVPVREINVVNDTTIEYQGKRIEITKEAFKDLIRIIGMSQQFANRFENLFNAEAKASFINQVKNAMSASSLTEITLILAPLSRKIVGFSKTSNNMISHERFMDLADQIIDQHGFEVTNWGVNGQKGEVSINVFNPKAQFGIGVADEVFTAGLTLRNSPLKGIQVMPYVNRLWCTNGLTTPLAAETYTLADLSKDSMTKFFEHMAQLRKNGFQPQGFADLAKKAMNTTASMYELQHAHNAVKRHVGDKADNWIPYNENRSAYMSSNMDLNQMNVAQLKNARSNQSIWSVVNGMTHVATHAPDMFAMGMTDKDSTQLMVQAGNILGSEWNLGNQVANPWKTNILDPEAQVGSLLN